MKEARDGSADEAISSALSTFVERQEVQERVDDITRLVSEYDQAVKLIREASRVISIYERHARL